MRHIERERCFLFNKPKDRSVMTRLSTATKVDNVESREYRRKLEVKPNTNMHVR